jgi:hypothetical protein
MGLKGVQSFSKRGRQKTDSAINEFLLRGFVQVPVVRRALVDALRDPIQPGAKGMAADARYGLAAR